MKLYNELAEYYYSIENDRRNIITDINLICSILKQVNHPSMLDLGCGTGEHLYELSKFGIKCTGIDSSEEMIRIANSRFNTSAEFIKSDMKSFELLKKFDLVISLFGSFNYMTEDLYVNNALQCIFKALKPEGIGLFEIWNAVPFIKIKEKPLTFVSETRYNEKIIKRERGFKLLDFPDKSLVEVKYNYTISDNETIRDVHIMRAFTLNEFRLFLGNNGFDTIAAYADPSLKKFNAKSGRIIILFKKR